MRAVALRVDFGQIVRDLRAGGLHPDAIGTEIGVHSTMVRLYQQGQQPRHAVGELLIGLWMKRTSLPRGAVPMYDGLDVEP